MRGNVKIEMLPTLLDRSEFKSFGFAMVDPKIGPTVMLVLAGV